MRVYGTAPFKNTNKKTRLSARYIGRGRWSRTTDNGVKVRCLTAWLHPRKNFLQHTNSHMLNENQKILGWIVGFEPTLSGATNQRFNQLSYTHHILLSATNRGCLGTPRGTRTPDLLLRRQLLYPAELLAHMERVMGIEPTQPAWKAGILAIELHPHRAEMSALR